MASILTQKLKPCCISILFFLLYTAPTAAPLNVAAQVVNSTALSLTWDPPVFEERNGAIREYSISMMELETNTSFQFLSLATELNVFDLHPYYTYSFQVAAVTVGIGPSSAVLHFQLPQDGMFFRSQYSCNTATTPFH